ncbi:MAG: serine hydrolase [Syntrophobacteraceae bacterium]
MRTSARRLLGFLVAAVVLCSIFSGFYLWKAALVASGYKAKCLCSDVFVSRRESASVLAEDLLPVGALYPLRFVDAEINYTTRTVKTSIMGFAERKAVFREGLGCTLAIGTTEEQLRSGGNPAPGRDTRGDENGTWPDGETVDTGHPPPAVDADKLSQAVEWAFMEPDPGRLRRTRALVVVYDGRIAAERYAPGFTAGTPLPGWSMNKSVFAALTGILIHQGKMSLESGGILPMWREGQDPRRTITLDNLLHMSSGLAFQEMYSSPLADVAVMLFGTRDTALFAASKSLVADPGVKWRYSSGTTNIISKVMRNTFGASEGDYLAFPRRALFDPIGMQSAVVEPDPSGTLVGSSFMYATARDWARFGLLYLRDGVWGKERILPEGWTQYCTTPAPASVGKEYGAHFWLRVPREFRSTDEPSGRMPRDAYHAVGFDGQFVSIIPSRKLVVVRLGLTRSYGAWDQEELIARILEAIR